MGENEELENLAKTLEQQGLATSYADSLEKAKQIMGIKEVIEKKRKDFLREGEAEKPAVREEPKQEPVAQVKEEVKEIKEEIKEPRVSELEQVQTVKEAVQEPEKKEEKKDSKEKEDMFAEERKIDISEVFNYGKR